MPGIAAVDALEVPRAHDDFRVRFPRAWPRLQQAFGDQAKIAKALAPGGEGKVFCPDCGKPILLRDVIEEKIESPAVKEQVREMQTGGD